MKLTSYDLGADPLVGPRDKYKGLRRPLTEEDKRNLREAYDKHRNYKDACFEAKVSERTGLRYLRENGLLKSRIRDPSQEVQDTFRREYEKLRSSKKASKIAGISDQKGRQLLKRWGIDTSLNGRRKRRTPEEVARAKELFEELHNIQKVADIMHCGHAAARRMIYS